MAHQLCGWRQDKAEAAYKALAHRFKVFDLKAPKVKGPPIWEFDKLVNGGKHLPSFVQEIGDCVSFGLSNAGNRVSSMQVALKRMEQRFRLWYPPYIYGTSRVDIGRGELGSEDGSTGAWAIEAVRQLGVLFRDDAGVPPYSGEVASKWGQGVPDQFKKLAADNPLRSASPITSVDQIKLALDNYRPCTYAISWCYGQGQPTVEKGGYRMLKRQRRPIGGHQVCLLHWNDDIDAAFLLNSWGAQEHAGVTSKLDEPPGGAYVSRADIERDMQDSNCEIYSLDGPFEGDPSDEWNGLFGR